MQTIDLDRELPEIWLIGPAVRALERGETVVIPTDTTYALACNAWDAKAVSRLYAAKRLDKSKRCSVICSDLKAVGAVARAVTDDAFRFMRSRLPGPYTLLFHASRDLPKQATGRRKTIGVRICDHPVTQALVEDFRNPLLVTSVPGWEDGAEFDPQEAVKHLARQPAVILDQGTVYAGLSTIVDFTTDPPELVRLGLGEVYEDEV